MKIKKIAHNLSKKYKYNIDTESLITELSTNGYDTVFFNTKSGDDVLKAYNINPNGVKAFTYLGPTKIVFVDNNLHPHDKVCVLLHELGHIMLNHTGSGGANRISIQEAEIEASTFAYEVLHTKKKSALIALCAVLTLLTVILAVTAGTINLKASNAHNAEELMDDNIVYVTPSGEKFHRESCIHIQGKNCTGIPYSEAVKSFSPCRVCNP